MINRKIAPGIVDAVDIKLKLKPYDYFTLDNGVPVYSIDAGAQEVLLIEWVFYAGNWYEDKNIIAATTNFMLKNGTKQKKAFAINARAEAASREAEPMQFDYVGNRVIVPALKVREFQFTGITRF